MDGALNPSRNCKKLILADPTFKIDTPLELSGAAGVGTLVPLTKTRLGGIVTGGLVRLAHCLGTGSWCRVA